MNRRRRFKTYGKIQHRIAPTLRYSQYLYEETLMDAVPEGGWWLDLGCGHQILPPWREKEEKRLVQRAGHVVGFDADWASLGKHRAIRDIVCGDIGALPFADNTFDLATANMVVEHLEKPETEFREILRVLKPGGVFLFHTANAYGYSTLLARMIPEFLKAPLVRLLQARSSEDLFKTYYRVNKESRIRRVASESGFQVVQIRFIASAAEFAVIAPLAIIELLWIRLLLKPAFRRLRPNLLVTLKKPPQNGQASKNCRTTSIGNGPIDSLHDLRAPNLTETHAEEKYRGEPG
jgi:SAM-dependent methyltransferase